MEAAKIAGLETVPCKVISHTTTINDRKLMSSIENLLSL
jgi:ParB-like chromosome segregation protein Spo0J